MASKRATTDAKSAATGKRTKRDDGDGESVDCDGNNGEHAYELELSGEIFVDVDKLFRFKSFQAFFKKKYKRSAKAFIDGEHLCVVYVSRENVEKRKLEEKTEYAAKSDCRLVKKDERVERLIQTARENSLPEAPPVIKDEDLKFFVDENGKTYQVKMRGARTKDGIYFKAKDVARVCDSGSFVKAILDERGSYKEGIHFVWFAVQKVVPHDNSQRKASDTSDQGHPRDSDATLHDPQQQRKVYHSSKEVFLTLSGLMHAIHVTRSSVMGEFRVWIENIVFALAYGTSDQKEEMISTLCKVDKSLVQVLMKLLPSDLSCLYLVETNIPADDFQGSRDSQDSQDSQVSNVSNVSNVSKDFKVYKFGYSGNMRKRFNKHHATYGPGTLLDTVVFVPADNLSKAESVLHNSLTKETQFKYNQEKELVSLNAAGRKTVRTIMQTIADKYNGSMAIQASKHETELKDLKHAHEVSELKYELRIKDLERIIDVLRAESNVPNVALLEEKLKNAEEKVASTREIAELRLANA